MRYLLIALFLLAGCETQPKRTIYDAAQDECRNLGFTPGTEAFGSCVQRDVQHRRDMAVRLLYGR